MLVSKKFENGITVHGISTGTVAVKKEHYQYSGLGLLRIPKILFGRTFVPDMPIWVWVIQTPSGNYLIDTGETTHYYDEQHFMDKKEDYVNRKILQIKVTQQQQINEQLKAIQLSTKDIDAVIMTHLHIDHTDGIGFFPQADFMVSKTDWEKPYGAPVSTFPNWFKPHLLTPSTTDLPFDGAYAFIKEISIVTTPGHTLGHQSVLLEVDGYHIMFAGDSTFNEAQLLKNQIGGINMDLKASKRTLKNIQTFSQQTKLIYLPSHDPQSGERLMQLQTTRA